MTKTNKKNGRESQIRIKTKRETNLPKNWEKHTQHETRRTNENRKHQNVQMRLIQEQA